MKIAILILVLIISGCDGFGMETSSITNRVDSSQRAAIPDEMTIRTVKVDLEDIGKVCSVVAVDGKACLLGFGTKNVTIYWSDRQNLRHEFDHIVFGTGHYD